jgi:hypothetical protein
MDGWMDGWLDDDDKGLDSGLHIRDFKLEVRL